MKSVILHLSRVTVTVQKWTNVSRICTGFVFSLGLRNFGKFSVWFIYVALINLASWKVTYKYNLEGSEFSVTAGAKSTKLCVGLRSLSFSCLWSEEPTKVTNFHRRCLMRTMYL